MKKAEKQSSISQQELTIFGYEVLGYVSHGDVKLPDDIIPLKQTPEHLQGFVEVQGFPPGACTRILGKVSSGKWVIRASDLGDPIFLVDPLQCRPVSTDTDLGWVQFEAMIGKLEALVTEHYQDTSNLLKILEGVLTKRHKKRFEQIASLLEITPADVIQMFAAINLIGMKSQSRTESERDIIKAITRGVKGDLAATMQNQKLINLIQLCKTINDKYWDSREKHQPNQ